MAEADRAVGARRSGAGRLLPAHRRRPRRGGEDRGGGGPPRVRLPVRERRLRPGRDRRRPDLDRAGARRDRGHGLQDRGQAPHGAGRGSAAARRRGGRAVRRRGSTAAGDEVGFPLLVKASAGGGGRGMRVVDDAPTDWPRRPPPPAARRRPPSATARCSSSATSRPPGTSRCRSSVTTTGRVVHLHERDCSIQRRHQKVIEEAPAPTLDDDHAGRPARRRGAGRRGDRLHQCRHRRVPAGPHRRVLLPGGQHPTPGRAPGHRGRPRPGSRPHSSSTWPPVGRCPRRTSYRSPPGHAIEARVYAEDPTEGFRPSTGRIHVFSTPDTVRVDSAFDADGGEVSQHYDPMIAKVVAHGAAPGRHHPRPGRGPARAPPSPGWSRTSAC